MYLKIDSNNKIVDIKEVEFAVEEGFAYLEDAIPYSMLETNDIYLISETPRAFKYIPKIVLVPTEIELLQAKTREQEVAILELAELISGVIV